MIYARMRKLVERGNYVKENMLSKLDVFLLTGRITNLEYKEIVELMA